MTDKAPLRHCDFCGSWRSRPCGEGCVWTSAMPTFVPNPDFNPVDACKMLIAELSDNANLSGELDPKFHSESMAYAFQYAKRAVCA